ncbi:MAG: GvpL/GvpF family gas vesicle protein [Bacteroidota bacterium]|nr:GvpL/GvpF family gas vesicle protein [Bacteroidota bacterium]
MATDLIYVYCLSNSPPVLHESMKLKGLKSLVFGDFHVVVKYVSEGEFSEENFKRNLSDIEWLEPNAREHIEVINLLMGQNTVIPFKFGTIFYTEDSLKKFITDYSGSLIENFNHIEGREEWSVKIYCDRKSLSEQIDELSEETAALEKQIMASSPGKAFLLKRKKSELIENEMDRICKSYGQDYYNEFKSLSVSTNLNNLLPKEFTGREDTMILNAAFLVSKTTVNDFKNTVDILRKKDGHSGFFIETTGPWPPFSFIYIKENP